MADITPLIIFSLPRSGSTLLQRILAVHEEIATVPEPWILLPFMYTLKSRGVLAEYNHEVLVRAVQDFTGRLPGGENQYRKRLRETVLRLYTDAANGRGKYLLDKTPRYSLVAEEIINFLPEAKFIFLFRNPLAVCASMITTWGDGHWCLYRYQYDLFDGLINLATAVERYKDRIALVQYEKLVLSPDEEIRKLCCYLDIDFDTGMTEKFSGVNATGKMGDPTGIRTYTTVTVDPLNKWQQILSSPIRRIWCRRYLKRIGDRCLHTMGYDLNSLLQSLNKGTVSGTTMVSDILRLAYGVFYAGSKRFLLNGRRFLPPAGEK